MTAAATLAKCVGRQTHSGLSVVGQQLAGVVLRNYFPTAQCAGFRW